MSSPDGDSREADLVRGMFDAMPQLAWVAQTDGSGHSYNRAFREYTGETQESLETSETWTRIGDPLRTMQTIDAWKACVASGEEFDIEYRLRNQAGDLRWFLLRIAPVRDGRGNVLRWLGIFTDIHHKKTTEDAERQRLVVRATSEDTERAKLEEARSAAEAANRAKDEFLAMLGHELRNPLAPIITAIEIQNRKEPVLTRERAIIERQVRHLKRMVDDLLDVSRIARGKVSLRKKRVPFSRIVATACEAVQPEFESKGQTLDARMEAAAIHVRGDETRLVQALTNLLTNASKYSSEGGTIRVRGRIVESFAEVEVEDDGQGVDPALKPHVFDLFEQGPQNIERAQGGLGLGLAIVKSLVERHGGEVWVESPGRDHGSRFGFRVPAMTSVSEMSAPPSVELPKPAEPKPTRILVVDDNRDAAELLGMALEARGHVVYLAHDGPSGLATAKERQPNVAVLDIGLPGMDGNQVAQEIRADSSVSGTILIALTGYGQAEDRERSREAGFDHFLVKPVELNELLALVAAAEARSEESDP